MYGGRYEQDHIVYFSSERDELFGDLQGRLILDFILYKIGLHIYNQAIFDTRRYIIEKAEDIVEFMR